MKIDDESGFVVLKANPISMVGVFQYSGKAIDPKGKMGLDPKKFYGVYRSSWELFDPKAIESFNGIPFQVGHETVGAGGKKVDDRPADGCIFNVRKSLDLPNVLIADFKIYTESILEKIKKEMNNLSLGYRCSYLPQKGVYNGQEYDFIQVRLRGNHVALVKNGRCGSGVRVYDSVETGDGDDAVTFDSLEEIQKMSEKNAKTETTVALDAIAEALSGANDELANDLVNFVKAWKPKGTMTGDENKETQTQVETTDGGDKGGKGGEDKPKGGEDKPKGGEGTPTGGEDKPKTHVCPDCGETVKDGEECPCKKNKGKTTTTDENENKGGEGGEGGEITPTGDSVEEIAAKLAAGHALAEKISEKIGTFDHAEMDEADVAHYACEKMGVTFDSAEAELGYVKGVCAMLTTAPKTIVVSAGDAAEVVRKEATRTAACHADYLGQ